MASTTEIERRIEKQREKLLKLRRRRQQKTQKKVAEDKQTSESPAWRKVAYKAAVAVVWCFNHLWLLARRLIWFGAKQVGFFGVSPRKALVPVDTAGESEERETVKRRRRTDRQNRRKRRTQQRDQLSDSDCHSNPWDSESIGSSNNSDADSFDVDAYIEKQTSDSKASDTESELESLEKLEEEVAGHIRYLQSAVKVIGIILLIPVGAVLAPIYFLGRLLVSHCHLIKATKLVSEYFLYKGKLRLAEWLDFVTRTAFFDESVRLTFYLVDEDNLKVLSQPQAVQAVQHLFADIKRGFSVFKLVDIPRPTRRQVKAVFNKASKDISRRRKSRRSDLERFITKEEYRRLCVSLCREIGYTLVIRLLCILLVFPTVLLIDILRSSLVPLPDLVSVLLSVGEFLILGSVAYKASRKRSF